MPKNAPPILDERDLMIFFTGMALIGTSQHAHQHGMDKAVSDAIEAGRQTTIKFVASGYLEHTAQEIQDAASIIARNAARAPASFPVPSMPPSMAGTREIGTNQNKTV